MSIVDSMLSREEVIAASKHIEPLPASVTRLLQLLSDPNACLRDFAEVIRYDAALTADLLRQANSTMQAVRDAITDVDRAVQRLGTTNVVAVAMTRAMKGRFSRPVPAYALEADALWRHSLASAVGAEAIADRSTDRIPQSAGTAALMHDIGKLVIAEFLPASFGESLLAAAEREELTVSDVERAVFGVDHGEIGAIVARNWSLPASVQIALTQHHVARDTADVLTNVVASADVIAHVVDGAEWSDVEHLVDHELIASLRVCGIREAEVAPLIESVSVSYLAVMERYNS